MTFKMPCQVATFLDLFFALIIKNKSICLQEKKNKATRDTPLRMRQEREDRCEEPETKERKASKEERREKSERRRAMQFKAASLDTNLTFAAVRNQSFRFCCTLFGCSSSNSIRSSIHSGGSTPRLLINLSLC